MLRDGQWFLVATCDVAEAPLNEEPVDWIGVDRGITNLATASEGTNYQGRRLARHRRRQARKRAELQVKKAAGSRSAARRPAKRREREARHVTHQNHTISKQIVAVAERTGLQRSGARRAAGLRRVRLGKPPLDAADAVLGLSGVGAPALSPSPQLEGDHLAQGRIPVLTPLTALRTPGLVPLFDHVRASLVRDAPGLAQRLADAVPVGTVREPPPTRDGLACGLRALAVVVAAVLQVAQPLLLLRTPACHSKRINFRRDVTNPFSGPRGMINTKAGPGRSRSAKIVDRPGAWMPFYRVALDLSARPARSWPISSDATADTVDRDGDG